MNLSPEDKAELDAQLLRSDYIVEHHKRKFKAEVDKFGSEINSASAFALGFLLGGAFTIVTWIWVTFLLGG